MTANTEEPPQWCVDTIRAFRGSDGRSPERIALLAERLAASGEVLAPNKAAADVASTGGPASLTTFIPPLLLASRGVQVPKVGVPGRPAGVIDTFGILPGYRTVLSRTELEEAVRQSNFGNTLSTGTFAPDDSVLFSARQSLGAQDVPALVVASLLSKKLAAGLTSVVFDIRTMNGGNFGRTPLEARRNIELLEATAALVGISAHSVVSDGERPAQPMLGRAEALRGVLALLNNNASQWLERHFETCAQLATLAYDELRQNVPTRADLRTAFDTHLRAQGANGIPSAEDYVARIATTHPALLITAPEEGSLCWNMVELRDAVVSNQGGVRGADFPDECGVELLCNTGDVVDRNTPIARIRAVTPNVLARTAGRVTQSITIKPRASDRNRGSQA